MTHNTRPTDFPTDAELAELQKGALLATLLEAFVGSPEWNEHDIRTQLESQAAQWGAEDARNGEPCVPEMYFVPGTLQYQEYVMAYQAAQR